jgi:hypothetical protein
MKKSMLLVALCLVTILSQAQLVAVVNFMKVPQGGGDAYMANEREWKKIHQVHVDEGKIVAWELFYIHNTGTNSPYNFATVDVYANLEAALNTTITTDEFKKIWGEKYNDVLKRTNAVRNLVYSETFNWEMGIQSKAPEKYIQVSYMKAKDLGKYYEMEKKAYLPMHQVAVDDGMLNGWSIWSRWFHQDTSYDAVAVNSYVSSKQITGVDYTAAMEKLKTVKNFNELYDIISLADKTSDIRTIVKSELWELIEITTPKK